MRRERTSAVIYLHFSLQNGADRSFKRITLINSCHKISKLNGLVCCVRLLQLTWRSNKILSYSIDDLDDVQELQSPLKVSKSIQPCLQYLKSLLDFVCLHVRLML